MQSCQVGKYNFSWASYFHFHLYFHSPVLKLKHRDYVCVITTICFVHPAAMMLLLRILNHFYEKFEQYIQDILLNIPLDQQPQQVLCWFGLQLECALLHHSLPSAGVHLELQRKWDLVRHTRSGGLTSKNKKQGHKQN